MALEVIGAGFGRTGTNSLKVALQMLGYQKCHHMKEVFGKKKQIDFWERAGRGEAVNWDEVYEGYKAAVDWPTAAYWKQLAAYYPNAKIVLSVRDPEAWYHSVEETIFPISYVAPPWFRWIQPDMKRLFEANTRLIWQGIFGGRFTDKAHAIEVFNRHNEEVKRYFPPERLLVHQSKDGWAPLCAFLGKPIPPEPYPRVNEAAEIKRVVAMFRWMGRLPWIAAGATGLIVLGVAAWLLT